MLILLTNISHTIRRQTTNTANMNDQKRCMWCGTVVPKDARFCPVMECAKEFPIVKPEPTATARLKRTNTIAISDDDDDDNNSRPGKSNGSVLTAKGASKVQAARKLAGKHDAMKHLNKSKYSVGAPSRRVAETFNIFLSLGDNYPLVQLSKDQKHFELKLDDKISSSDEFF